MGRRAQLRRARCRAGARVRARERGATGSTSSTSTACGSTPPSSIFDARRAHPRRHRRSACARRAGGRHVDRGRRERAAGRAARSRPSRRRLRARRAVERRLPPRRARRPDRAQRSLLHRLSRHAAGARVRARSTAFCIRASTTRGSSKPRGTPALDRPGRDSSLSSRTTIRSRTRPPASGCHELSPPGQLRALTALLLLGPATPHALPGPGVRLDGAVPATSPTTSPSSAELVRTGRQEFLSQFPADREPRRRHSRRPGCARDLRAVQADYDETRSISNSSGCCIAICWPCGATTRAFSLQGERRLGWGDAERPDVHSAVWRRSDGDRLLAGQSGCDVNLATRARAAGGAAGRNAAGRFFGPARTLRTGAAERPHGR